MSGRDTKTTQPLDGGTAGKERKRPTLKTIAYMTGLGVTTVSKALKDAPDIGHATKERVKLVAKQIGYRPNNAGLRLRTGQTHQISLILSTDETVMGLTSHMIEGLSQGLMNSPYHLVVTPYSHKKDSMLPVQSVVENGSADGIILSRTEPSDRRVSYLIEQGIPFVTHGRTELPFAHAFYDYDNAAFARDAVEHLVVARGRRSVALIEPPTTLTFHRYMLQGFKEGLANHGARRIALETINSDSEIEEIAEALHDVLKDPAGRPDALICPSAGTAIGACIGLERAGLTVGEEIDVVAKHAPGDLLNWMRPGLFLWEEDFLVAGEHIARQMLARLDGAEPESLQDLTYRRPDFQPA